MDEITAVRVIRLPEGMYDIAVVHGDGKAEQLPDQELIGEGDYHAVVKSAMWAANTFEVPLELPSGLPAPADAYLKKGIRFLET